jgi:hypothetical protein
VLAHPAWLTREELLNIAYHRLKAKHKHKHIPPCARTDPAWQEFIIQQETLLAQEIRKIQIENSDRGAIETGPASFGLPLRDAHSLAGYGLVLAGS